MAQRMKHIFRVGIDRVGDLFRGFPGASHEFFAHLFLKLQQFRRCFFPSLHAGLIVGVDIDQRSIEAHRALIHCDQRADVKRVHFRDAHRDRFASALIKRASCPAQKSMEIIAAGKAIFDAQRCPMPILVNLDKGHEKIQDTVTQLLDVGVLIG